MRVFCRRVLDVCVDAISGALVERELSLIAGIELDSNLSAPKNGLLSYVDALPASIWIAGANGCILSCNRHWREYAGMSSTPDCSYADLQRAIHEDDRAAHLEWWQRTIAGQESAQFRVRLRAASGAYRAHISHAALLRPDEKEPAQWVIFNADVHALERLATVLHLFTEASEILSSSLDLEVTLERMACVPLALFADWCEIMLLDEAGRLRTRAVAHHDEAKARMLYPLRGTEVTTGPGEADAHAVLSTGRSMLISSLRVQECNLSPLEEARATAYARVGASSGLIVPLRSRRTIIGAAMFMLEQGNPHVYSIEDVKFGEQLASAAALAYENSMLYEEQRSIASTLQRSFLPRSLPVVPGMIFSAVYLPSARHALIGGDWYDAFWLEDGRIAISIGDVSGHGIEAAAAMVSVRHTIRAAALQRLSPEEIIRHANQWVLAEDGGRLVTAIVGVINPSTRTFTYANAGHPAPVVACAGQPARVDDEYQAALPLGIEASHSACDHVIAFSHEALLLLYTDGLIEHNRQPVDGEAELLRAAEHAMARYSESDAGWVEQAIVSKALEDDAALLAVRFTKRGLPRLG